MFKGAGICNFKLLGGEGATALVFPSLAKTILENRRQAKELLEGKQRAEEGVQQLRVKR